LINASIQITSEIHLSGTLQKHFTNRTNAGVISISDTAEIRTHAALIGIIVINVPDSLNAHIPIINEKMYEMKRRMKMENTLKMDAVDSRLPQ
jgi:hypothetical protein